MAYKTATIGLNSYLQSSGDRMLQIALQHEKKKKLQLVVKGSRTFKFQVSIIDINTKQKKAAKDKSQK